jgi:ribonuclease-3
MISRQKLQSLLGSHIKIGDLSLYTEALVHKSCAGQFGFTQERLEHLGDAVLSLCVTHMLYEKHPRENEGFLTKMRTRLVNGKTLASIGRAMQLQQVIISDTATASLDQDRIYEDTLEALIGAMYLDLGLNDVGRFIAAQYDLYMDPTVLAQDTNYKEKLRRATIDNSLQGARYITQHYNGVFHCEVWIGDTRYGEGEGNSKKAAEMEAAHNVLLSDFPEFENAEIH